MLYDANLCLPSLKLTVHPRKRTVSSSIHVFAGVMLVSGSVSVVFFPTSFEKGKSTPFNLCRLFFGLLPQKVAGYQLHETGGKMTFLNPAWCSQLLVHCSFYP